MKAVFGNDDSGTSTPRKEGALVEVMKGDVDDAANNLTTVEKKQILPAFKEAVTNALMELFPQKNLAESTSAKSTSAENTLAESISNALFNPYKDKNRGYHVDTHPLALIDQASADKLKLMAGGQQEVGFTKEEKLKLISIAGHDCVYHVDKTGIAADLREASRMQLKIKLM